MLITVKAHRAILIFLGLVLLTPFGSSQSNTTRQQEDKDQSDDISECIYIHGYLVGNKTDVERCCNETVKEFEKLWYLGNGRDLTSYLETLRGWKCPRFEEECKQRLFNYTEYTQNVYKYFCEYETFVDSCFDEVEEAFMRNNNHDELQTQTVATGTNSTNDQSIYAQWNSIISRLQANSLSSSDLSKPCVQVALYEADEDHLGDYHEVIHINLPSCEVVWCGYDGETLRERIISSWTCMSFSCRAKMVSIMVICVLIGIVITTVNILVIAAITRNVDLRHSQGIYKISLAVADLIVGLIVFPTFAATLGRLVTTRLRDGPLANATGYLEVDGVLDQGTSVEISLPANRFLQVYSRPYLDFIGFFTVLSLTVSVFTLTVAGFDRFSAVYRPLSYRKDKAKTYARILCFVVWLLGILFSMLPLFTPTLQYSLIASILISSGGRGALVLYVVAFVIPLVIMWVINIATYQSTKKHAKVRRHLTIDSKRKTQSIETRLARTLGLMVGVFTLSIVPVALVILSSLFVGTIYFSQPRRVDVQGALVYNTFEFISIIILSCNSLWNFFIYNGRNLEFRKEVRAVKKSLFDKLGLDRCCDVMTLCAQRVAHDSRRRFSSIPSLSTYTGNRKKSSLATSTIKLSSESSTLDQTPSMLKTTTNLDVSTTGANGRSENNTSSQTEFSVASEKKSYKPIYKKNGKGKHAGPKSQNGDSSLATDDSVFRSFVIDANADRLFMSVMENIDEEITEQTDAVNGGNAKVESENTPV
ncbi:unnamed protein product [Clavelina lepadiformis]|uniref:G-protein coupled receptors family 1 profile domain-containing protein n=1 Tax=Clavelina lepadiformis TaxID=159417 RepID=A0ABP0FNH3_CLALP